MRWKRRLRKTSLNRLDRTEDSLVKFYKNFKKITQLFSFKCAKFSWSRTNTTANDASNNPLSIYQLIYFRWERQCERDFAWCTRIYARITLKFNRCKVTSDLTLNLRIKKNSTMNCFSSSRASTFAVTHSIDWWTRRATRYLNLTGTVWNDVSNSKKKS